MKAAFAQGQFFEVWARELHGLVGPVLSAGGVDVAGACRTLQVLERAQLRNCCRVCLSAGPVVSRHPGGASGKGFGVKLQRACLFRPRLSGTDLPRELIARVVTVARLAEWMTEWELGRAAGLGMLADFARMANHEPASCCSGWTKDMCLAELGERQWEGRSAHAAHADISRVGFGRAVAPRASGSPSCGAEHTAARCQGLRL